MIRDYWIDEGGDYVGGEDAFLPYRMLRAYADEPSGGTATTAEATMARLFELRLMLDFEAYRVLCAPSETSSLGHYVLTSCMRHLARETRRFDGLYWPLYDHLGTGQRSAVSHLLPVAQEASGMAKRTSEIMGGRRNGGGCVTGGVPDPLDEGRVSLESGVLACANLINVAIDGTMHAVSEDFACALGKAFASGPVTKIGDSEVFVVDVEKRARRTTHCMDLGSLDGSMLPLVSELARMRWNVYALINTQRQFHEDWEGDRVSADGKRILVQRVSWNLGRIALELGAFLDIYPRISSAVGDGRANDGIFGDVLPHEAAIRGLCGIVSRGGEPLVRALERDIGYERLLLLAAGVAEWAGVNVGHYQARCPNRPPLPDLPWGGPRVDFEAVSRVVSLARTRAQNALARAGRGECPTVAA